MNTGQNTDALVEAALAVDKVVPLLRKAYKELLPHRKYLSRELATIVDALAAIETKEDYDN